MEMFLIALKNVLRNKRRTILNTLALVIGITMMVMAQGWLRGFVNTIYNNTIEMETGHLQILNKDYQDEKRRLPLDLGVNDYNTMIAKLRTLDSVEGVSPRIDFGAQISNGTESIRVFARAVDPEAERSVSTVGAQIKVGSYFTKTNGILIGRPLAKKLGIVPGQAVYINSVDKYGVSNLFSAEVEGLFEWGYPQLDEHFIITPLAFAQTNLSIPDSVTRIVVRLKKGWDLDERVKAFSALFADRKDLKVYDWKEFSKDIVSTIESRIRIISAIISVLFLLILIGIMNSMSMSVQERFREIGTMRAIGLNRWHITKLFLAEGIWIGLLGAGVGVILASILGFVMYQVGIDVRTYIPKEIPVPFASVMRPDFQVSDFLIAVGAGTAVALIGTLGPARRAGKLEVREALGSHL